MNTIDRLELKPGSNEEKIPNYSESFPYVASRVELDKYQERYVPWHWHNTLELFYMESGVLEYCIPGGTQIFPAGSGGLVNSNVLHMTKLQPHINNNVQLIHLFDPVFISGEKGNRIDQKYVMPFTAASQIEIVPLFPDNSKQESVLKLIRESFKLNETQNGYEIQLREKLSEIWLGILEIAEDKLQEKSVYRKSNDQIKQMMIYIQEHYSEKISIMQLANSVFLSERGCYRVFQECLHMTPAEYIRNYRLQMACQMLSKGSESLTEISHACGLGTSSYFWKIFKENIGCTPQKYRQKWQNCDIKGQD